MPEPNLPPLVLNMTDLNDSKHVCVKPIISSLPELPEETRKKLINAHQLSTEYAIQLVNEDVLLNYFYKIIENPNRSPKKVADLLMMELRTSLNKFNISLNDCLIKSDVLAEVHDLLESKTINLKTVRNILDIIIGGDTSSPTEIIKKNNWYLLSDDSLIQSICENVITENPKHVNRYKNGKTKALYTLLGIIAKNNDSNLDMKKVSEKLEELLKEIK